MSTTFAIIDQGNIRHSGNSTSSRDFAPTKATLQLPHWEIYHYSFLEIWLRRRKLIAIDNSPQGINVQLEI
jgi:hypothetical protein